MIPGHPAFTGSLKLYHKDSNWFTIKFGFWAHGDAHKRNCIQVYNGDINVETFSIDLFKKKVI